MGQGVVRMKRLAKTIYKKGYYLEWQTDFMDSQLLESMGKPVQNDINVILRTNEGKYLGDAICHYGSYGVEDNLWETMIEGIEDVTGHLTFKEVIKQFDQVIRKYEKKQL